MLKTPQISVIFPCFNSHIKPVEISLNSIKSQTFKNFECLIIDDSTDPKFIDFLKNFSVKDLRFKYLRGDSKGLGNAINKGLTLAKGEYIARSDDTDVSHFERLKTQFEFLKKNNSVDILGSNMNLIYQNGRKEGSYTGGHKEIAMKFLYKNPIAHPSVMFRAKILKDGNFYDGSFKLCEDLEFWLRLLRKGYRFHNLSAPLVNYDATNKKINKKNLFYNFKARFLNVYSFLTFLSLFLSSAYFLFKSIKIK